MALPSSLGDYTKWDSTDILNRFKDGCKPTVEDWEAISPYLFPMQFSSYADNSYTQFKELYDRYITQGTVLDADFFLSLFNIFIRDNNYPFWSNYVNSHSPYYKNSEFCLTTAFANGAKPTQTIFAGYLQALLSPIAFTDNYKTGFALQDTYNSSWMEDTIIQGEITVSTATNVRAHNDINIVYNITGRPSSNRPFTLIFPKQCICAAPNTNLNATLRLICRGRITDVGQNVLAQTEIALLFNKKMSIPTLQQINSSTFSMTFTVDNVQPIFIINAYTSNAFAEGMALVQLVGD